MTLSKETNKTPANTFRWSYIALPAAVLAVSLLLTAVFYSRLPAELAYHFKSDGTPDLTMGRNQIILILLLPQVMLTLVAAGTSWAMVKVASRLQNIQIAPKPEKPVPVSSTGQALSKFEGIIGLMGNILALPEIVLALFMLDVFLYNVFQIHFLPIWLSGVIVMVVGGIFIGVFLLRAFRQTRRTTH
jgi:uncharacterized membrane protein